MTYLNNKCLIDKETADYLLRVIKLHCDSYTYDEQKELQQALNQDLSGMVLVPVEPSTKQHEAARDWSYKVYGKPIGVEASDGCYKAMIAAAPKLEE